MPLTPTDSISYSIFYQDLREKDWLNAGGEFVVPLPNFRIINNDNL